MTDPATPKALRAIASMMRVEGYKPDANGIEALVVSNAADEIDRLQAERDWQYDENVNRIAKEGAALLEVEKLRETMATIAHLAEGTRIGGIARAALEGK